MARRLWLVLACIVLGCGGPSAQKTLPHEVLKSERRAADGKLILEVLVDEKTTKDQVLLLVEALRREHAGGYAYINIFDSREAQQRRLELSYPTKDLYRHWLVQVDGPEVHWLADGRDH